MLEVSKAFLFRENRTHGTDRGTGCGAAGSTPNAAPRRGRIIIRKQQSMAVSEDRRQFLRSYAPLWKKFCLRHCIHLDLSRWPWVGWFWVHPWLGSVGFKHRNIKIAAWFFFVSYVTSCSPQHTGKVYSVVRMFIIWICGSNTYCLFVGVDIISIDLCLRPTFILLS